MEKFDEKIMNMARKESIEMPEGYEERIEKLLIGLSQEHGIKGRKRSISNFTKMAAGFAMIMVISIGAFLLHAGTSDQQTFRFEKNELDEMCIITTNRLDIEKDENGSIEYCWNSYDELQNGLGIRLLRTENECGLETMIITEQTDNEDYHIIQIQNFAVMEQADVNLKISIRCSEEQSIEGLLPEFAGDYQRRGNYVSKQGYKVVFVGGKTVPLQSTKEDVVDGVIFGFFVADGILYRVSGEMSVNQMKEFIDSLT